MKIRRGFAMGVLVALVSFGLVGCQSGDAQVAVYSWHASPTNSRTITLVVYAGERDEITRAEVLAQDRDQVTVAVWVRGVDTGPGGGVAVAKETDVTLDAPIGARAVVNEDGSVVPNQ